MVIERQAEEGSEALAGGWQAVIPVTESVALPPDPHFMDAIGGNHRLETAVADLVDNAIDAGAASVLIRFVVAADRVQSFYVIDDGCGMTDAQIDAAMTVGGVREYGETDLGHFGLGLKAASFSQADSLTVISRRVDTAAVGRRWLTRSSIHSFECDIIGQDFCAREVNRAWGYATPTPGTIVRWDDIRAFPSGNDAAVTSRFVHDASQKLQQHLGLVFHRFLHRDQVRIGIDVEDADLGGSGPVLEVVPLDPFGYMRAGAAGYPKDLTMPIGSGSLSMVCHVWPARSALPQFRLYGESGEQRQGLYFYRHDRLLQAGGWNNIEVPRKDLQLARVSVEIGDGMVATSVFRMNPEKSKVETGHEFSAGVDRAVSSDGTRFQAYVATARETLKSANKRSRARTQVVPLGRGVPPVVRRTMDRELTTIPGYEAVDLRWRPFADDIFFDIDRETNTIWLNAVYRQVLTGNDRAVFNDAPLVKMLLFLLVENLFHGSWWGPKDKDNLELWQALLTAAAREALE